MQQTRLVYRPSSKLQSYYSGGAFTVSRDGELFASAHENGIKVVHTDSGAVLRDLGDGDVPITALCFGRTSGTLYASTRNLQIIRWNLESGHCLKAWKVNCLAIVCLAIDANEERLAVGGVDRSLTIWDMRGSFCTHAFKGHRAPVLQVLFHTSNLTVISAAEDGDIRIWDMSAQACKAQLKGHAGPVTALSISASGWTLMSAARDKTVILWDLKLHMRTKTLPLYEAIEGAQLIEVSNMRSNSALEKADRVAADTTVLLASAGEEGIVKLWDTQTAKCVASYNVSGSKSTSNQLTYLAVVGNGNDNLVLCTADARIIILKAKATHLQLMSELIGDYGEVTDLALLGSCDSTYLAVASNSPSVRIFELASGKLLESLIEHQDIVLCLSVSSDISTRSLILLSGSKDGFVALWNVQMPSPNSEDKSSGNTATKCQACFKAHMSAVTAVALGQKENSRLALTASADRFLKVWSLGLQAETQSGKKFIASSAGVSAHDKDINCIAISQNEFLACTGSQDRTAKIWRLPNLQHLSTLRGHKRGVWSVAFSPIEKAIATASGDHTVKLWSIESGTCLKTFQGHLAAVLRLLYVSHGSQIVSTGGDGLMKLWDIHSGACVATFDEHTDRVWALAGSASGDLLVTGGADATICVWQDATREKLEEATAAKLVNATAQQDFSNAMQDKDFSRALKLAWDNKYPQSFRQVIEHLQQDQFASVTIALTDLVSAFSKEQLRLAFCMMRDWNTNAQHAEQAQAILHSIFLCHPPEVLAEVSALEDVLDGLAPYLERHIAHTDRLLISSNVVDFTLLRMQHMQVSLPQKSQIL